MGISFDKYLGPHDDALLLRSKRSEILASNLAYSADGEHQF